MSAETYKSVQGVVVNSLKNRIIISALLLILVIMPLIGITLNDAFKQQAKNAVKNELSAYIYSVLAVAEFENQQLYMPEQLLENRFNVIQSGLYALISKPQLGNKKIKKNGANQIASILWQSDSFLGFNAPKNLLIPAIGESVFSEILLNKESHLVYSFTVSFEQKDSQNGEIVQLPITIHIIKDQSDYQQQVKKFSEQLWSWLFILMIFLLLVQLTWLLWTLNPLAKFSRELTNVEKGKSNQINAFYPRELQVVAEQINTLLSTEQNQRKRYRNALSDLAHSLKTPLAVIQSQQDLSESSCEQVGIINNIIGHQLKRAQSGASASWYLGVKVHLVSDKLVRVLMKIYQHRVIIIDECVDSNAIFKGDQADLSEILGNLLDNACKAAKSQVLLTVTQLQQQLEITVEDDGKGINAQQQKEIFERGIRADSYQQGHGVGLAIVRDLVDSYNGQLVVGESQKFGGAKFYISFNYTKNRLN